MIYPQKITNNGVKILKKDANLVLKKLKELNSIKRELKIYSDENCVFVPIEESKEKQIEQLLNVKIKTYSFEIIKKSPKSIREILEKVLPKNLQELIPTSFDQIGTLAVIDIKENYIPYESEIGNAILSVHPSIKSVFRKISKVDGMYRIRKLKCIAGPNNTITVHKENGIKLFIDISKVYFSPRLSTEHERIAKLINSSDNVLDLFGGIAPFAFHILKYTKANITSVDINQNVTQMIIKSMKLNKIKLDQINLIIGDAEKICENFFNQGIYFNKIIMNHPSASIKYLEFANRIVSQEGIIFLYIFAPILNLESYCHNLIKENELGLKIKEIHRVRQFSPSEYHVCLHLKKES